MKDNNEIVVDWSLVGKSVLAKKKNTNLQRAEDIRARMDIEYLVTELHNLAKQADYADLKELPRLAFKADIYKTLLKKCLPDLRSLEVQQDNQKHARLTIVMSDEDYSIDSD